MLLPKRVVFRKFLNCGQTCVAPDHIYCEKNVKDAFLAEVMQQIKLQCGEKPLEKSIVDKKTWLDLPMRYRPYRSKLYEKLLHIFLR